MSFLADSLLLDSGISNLLHVPEILDRLVSIQPARGHEGRRVSAAGDLAGDERGSGGAPVDILENPKSYTFFLDVPGLAKSEIQVEERLVSVEDLLDADEVFCTGTAVVIAPVNSVTYKGQRYKYNCGEDAVSRKLHKSLTAIQMGLVEDKKGWTVEIE